MNQLPFHVLAKPIGPICNLACRYCYYGEKKALFPNSTFRLPDDLLESFIRQYIESQPTPEVQFGWQGGEPTLLGVDWFRHVVEVQKKYAGGKRIANSIQTNGTLLDDTWGQFLAENRFLVGLSIDGPREFNDPYRVDAAGNPSFDLVMRGLEVLHKHHVEFNTLTVVQRLNSRKPREIYSFLKQIGSRFLQFIPLVERKLTPQAKAFGLSLALPPNPRRGAEEASVTDGSVLPPQYGKFLIDIFDVWIQHDVGAVFVQTFDAALGLWMGLPSSVCVFAGRCGNAVVLEHNGDIYACDHYVYPAYRRGNMREQSLTAMIFSEAQIKFGADKQEILPRQCRECEFKFACHGGCPKHRFLNTPAGEPGLNYLCAGYRNFFRHINPSMQAMARLLKAGRPAADIMAKS
ncbi:MAG: anaerobic sulfatase maturase [Kiritimatiellae bacterium]|nr:anaerobic sulfatase maturase [Kiritimatiellia bacterium]